MARGPRWLVLLHHCGDRDPYYGRSACCAASIGSVGLRCGSDRDTDLGRGRSGIRLVAARRARRRDFPDCPLAAHAMDHPQSRPRSTCGPAHHIAALAWRDRGRGGADCRAQFHLPRDKRHDGRGDRGSGPADGGRSAGRGLARLRPLTIGTALFAADADHHRQRRAPVSGRSSIRWPTRRNFPTLIGEYSSSTRSAETRSMHGTPASSSCRPRT